MDEIQIKSPFIRLDQALKLSSVVSSGAEAKIRIQEGDVWVNEAPCTQRGKKLVVGDRIRFEDWEGIVVEERR
ncbi:MAG: RNA-binding S4 domain-containing protein [Peptoniphilaceae bacterium]|nr:RNA-binding S4 domain-containing protein [Peptoniphilaceae bacterium]MDY6085310.1 RNA-binding S4 domain-containing protein [Peptoniphilaceae bacterium]